MSIPEKMGSILQKMEGGWEKLAAAHRTEVADRLQQIIQGGGTEAFLKTQGLPRASSLLAMMAPANLAEYEQDALGKLEKCLRVCETCENGEHCGPAPDPELARLREMYPTGDDVPGRRPEFQDGALKWIPCAEWADRVFRDELAEAGVGKRFLNHSLHNFKPQTPSQIEALNIIRAYMATLPGTPRGLMITGAVGVGKTHLAVGILSEARQQGMKPQFTSVPSLMAKMRLAVGGDGGDAAAILNQASQADLLVLDDLGAERITDWAREQLFLLVNERYEAMLPTVITTNDTLEQLEEHIGQRIVSRLMETCDGVILDGGDYRGRRTA